MGVYLIIPVIPDVLIGNPVFIHVKTKSPLIPLFLRGKLLCEGSRENPFVLSLSKDVICKNLQCVDIIKRHYTLDISKRACYYE